MNDVLTYEDEQQRRVLQEYIFGLEEAKDKAEELESSILDAISHTVIGLKNRIIIFANNAVEEVFGWKPQEVIGKSTRLFYKTDEEYKRLGSLYAALEKQRLFSSEVYCRHRDGRSMICRLTASRIGTNLKDKQIVVTYEDITDRKRFDDALKESEEKYRNIFENTLDGVFQITHEGNILSANPALAKIHGADSPSEFMADVPSLDTFFVAHNRLGEFKRLIEKNGFVHGFEARMRCKGGGENWVSINARSVTDNDGQVLRYEGTIRDISERKRLESQLMQSQKMEAIGTLAGGVAHDINNILMGIQGYVSLMLYDADQPSASRERLRSIEDLVRSGANLTRQLLGFARGGKYEVRSADINAIVEKTAAMFGRTKKEIIVHTNLEESLYSVEVDHGQIEQVLVNLYVNAWQAMPAGGELYLETRNINLHGHLARTYAIDPGLFIRISVTDTGIGMDAKTKERIFEPFFTTKEMGRGTGLGLASVYGIVKNHGGFINVYSEKGQGSTFNVYLPASEKEYMAEQPFVSTILKGTERILIVDDEESIATVCKGLLETLGYEAVTARSGKEALEIYCADMGVIDLVILDMIMPDMGGEQTFEALKAADPDVKVILSSGYSMNSQATRIMDQGCSAFIQKPFDIHNLSLKIREVIEK